MYSTTKETNTPPETAEFEDITLRLIAIILIVPLPLVLRDNIDYWYNERCTYIA